MSDNLDIEKLFQDKFESFESDVSPDIWSNISQSIGSTAGTTGAAASTGMATWLKTALISGGVIVAGATGVYLATDNDETPAPNENNEIALVDTPEDNTEETNNETITLSPEVEGDTALENKEQELEEELNEVREEVGVLSPEVIENIIIEMEGVNDQSFDIDDIISELEDKIEETKKEAKKNADQNTDSNVTEESDDNSDDYVEVEDPSESEDANEVEFDYPLSIDAEINIFTPNGDGVNDFWHIKHENVEEFSIKIFDRNGVIVFTSDDPDFKWDGYDMRGERVQPGTFMFRIVATGDEDQVKALEEFFSVSYR